MYRFLSISLLLLLLLASCMEPRSRKDINKNRNPPVKMFKGKELEVAQAIYDGNIPEMEQLIKTQRIDINHISKNGESTFLMYACLVEDQKAMEKLLQMGADPNLISPDNGGYSTPVEHAVALVNYDMLNLLLKYNASLNTNAGRTALQNAMFLGDYETDRPMIDFLLQHGADINHQSYYGDNIMYAAYLDGVETVHYLLDKGGSPYVSGTKYSPMAISLQKDIDDKVLQEKNSKSYAKIVQLKERLEKEYGVKFPAYSDTLQEIKIRIRLYEKLSPKDKMVVNFHNNYGEDKYKQDLEELKKLVPN